METLDDLPCAVGETDTVWIPMSDGCRLAAKLWLPGDADTESVPAIIEYLPYRRGDGTAARDAVNHGYLAGHGYACLRIDIRGTGDSDGLFIDEYTEQEQLDCVEAISWIAAQPWCSGAVGMWGISWGGFNALQVAARRPPALKAIITVCSTDDRYADDTHYMGGCLLLGNLNWGSAMFAIASQPPDPDVVGEGWCDIWLRRLDTIPHLVASWTEHQRRDGFWQQGSVCEDYAAITCAVFAVGGWADAYTNAIPRLLAGLKAPRLGLIGPWAHAYPHQARPGPAIGFLQESQRWWDHWLKGHETGIMDEPMLRAWMQDPAPPRTHYDHLPGRWIAELHWPSPNITQRSYFLAGHVLAEACQDGGPAVVASPQTVGIASGAWCPYGLPGELPGDQRIDDGQAVVWETAPLGEQVEMLGAPVLVAEVSSDQPNAFLVARLSAVAPDGAATRLSYGALNLTHRDSHAEPAPLEPGRRYSITLRLNDLGQMVPAGYRLRLALTNAYWPTIWPSPKRSVVTVYPVNSHLDIPVRTSPVEQELGHDFGRPEGAAPLRTEMLRPPSRARRAEVDLTTGAVKLISLKDRGSECLLDKGLVQDNAGEEIYSIGWDDPLSARAEMRWRTALQKGAWKIKTETVTVQTATERAFLISTTLDAYEDDRRIFSRAWNFKIPRDLV